jgi:hypothetical protein
MRPPPPRPGTVWRAAYGAPGIFFYLFFLSVPMNRLGLYQDIKTEGSQRSQHSRPGNDLKCRRV